MKTFLFYVVAFEKIKIQTCKTLQNDRLSPSAVKDINVVGKEMTRNGRKMRITIVTIVTTRLGESVFSVHFLLNKRLCF